MRTRPTPRAGFRKLNPRSKRMLESSHGSRLSVIVGFDNEADWVEMPASNGERHHFGVQENTLAA